MRKKIVRWLGVIALVVLVIYAFISWFFYVPYKPEKLLAAIPSNTVFLSFHQNPGGRIDQILPHPIVQTALNITGPELQNKCAELTNNIVLRSLIERLGDDRWTVAYLPGKQDTWIFTGWLGKRAKQLRLALPWQDWGLNLKQLPNAGQWPVWVSTQKNPPVYFSFVEGGIIGCISSDPREIKTILAAYDRQTPPEFNIPAPTDYRDWGMVKLPDQENLLWAIKLQDKDSLSGCLTMMPPTNQPHPQPIPADSIKEIGRFLGDQPLAGFVISSNFVQTALSYFSSIPEFKVFAKEFAQLDNQLFFFGILGGDLQARILGLKWPGVAVGMKITNKDEALRYLNALITPFNKLFKYELSWKEIQIQGRSIYFLEATRDGTYGRLPFREHVSFTICDHWLLGAANMDLLLKLVGRYEAKAANLPSWLVGWQKTPATSYAWVDIEEGIKVGRLCLTAYALKLLFDTSPEAQEERELVLRIKNDLNKLNSLQLLELWLANEGNRLVLNFRIGQNAAHR